MAEASRDIPLAGETLRLYADRALYWPAKRRLLVTDVHLGKDDAFRAHGIALPRGSAHDDLQRLSTLLERSGATSLWVLGDLLHGPGAGARWRHDWARFRERHSGVDMLLIEGNHDRAAAGAGLGIARCADGLTDGPFLFAHAPHLFTPNDNGRIAVCGHLHPVVRVAGFRARFPAFALIERQFVLPAFSAFTGGWTVRGAQARYACMGPHLLAIDR